MASRTTRDFEPLHFQRLLQDFRNHDSAAIGHIETEELVLLLCRLSPKHFDGASARKLLDSWGGVGGGHSVDYASFLSWLHVTESPVKALEEERRDIFLRNEWDPFIAELASLLAEVRRRKVCGYSAHEVMPSHRRWAHLADRCQRLTARWHGTPNLSAVYEYFMEAAQFDGHSPYLFQDVPQQRSLDGYTRVLDGQARERLYSKGGQTTASCSGVGCVTQKVGESPIDNLVMPGVFRRRAALTLLVGHRIQQQLLKWLQWKQKRICSGAGLIDAAPGAVRERLAQDTIADSLAYQCLLERGMLLESYGQLPGHARAKIETYLLMEFDNRIESLDIPEGESLFVEHCWQHPGRVYKTPVQQKLMLLKVMANPDLRLLWRSDLENFTQHKYFLYSWQRSVPLLAASAADLVTLRSAGAKEVSRFRKNVFAYGESHGLGQSGGGCAELDEWRPGKLMYELGTLLCEDEGAKVPNHGVTDIERVVRDCMMLCPAGGLADALPGEVLHDAGQNPIIASSIGPTQHTQIMRAAAEDFPLVTERHDPQWYAGLGAWLDVVQVGESEDAFMVTARFVTLSVGLLDCLVRLRARFMRDCGDSVDFNCGCHPIREGGFVICFVPVARMSRLQVPPGEGAMGSSIDFENAYGERFTQQNLPVAMIDASHGKGNVLAFSDAYWDLALEGRPVLVRLYDFNRKPGARAIITSFLLSLQAVRS